MTNQTMPLPIPDADSEFYWEGCRAGELRLQRCAHCGKVRYPPRPACPDCHSFRTDWVVASGRGRIYSWVVVHHPVHPLVQDKVPYTLVLVDLEEGPRMVSQLINASAESVRADLPVEVEFRPISDDLSLPFFRPASST